MDLHQTFSAALSAGNIAALPLALIGGLIAGVNPCCLALYPAAACACGVQEKSLERRLRNAVAFVLGVALAISLLGSLAAYIGHVAVVSGPVRYAIAFVPILMGVHLLGWIRLPLMTPRAHRPGLSGAFGTGLLLSLIIGPCGTPVLASVLSYAAYKRSFLYGGILLFLYGIGDGLPLVLVGTAAGGFLKRLGCSSFGKWIDPILGSLLVLLGFYLLWRA